MARFFIDRPIFAWVVSLGILLAGFISLRALPIEQYPEVAPPSLAISVVYPGADAATLETNVTQVIEQQLNGVEGFLYMSSSSLSNGTASITSFMNGLGFSKSPPARRTAGRNGLGATNAAAAWRRTHIRMMTYRCGSALPLAICSVSWR